MIRIEVLAKTCENGELLTDPKVLGGKLAGICYMPDDYCSNAIQDIEGANRRAEMTAKSGHHSVFDHGSLTLLLQDIPKIVVMLLNSTEFYTTSEKSARYTTMDAITGYERFFYDKWVKLLTTKIQSRYNNIDDTAAKKLAQENARYMTSVFTPTVLAYTTSYRQLNYLVDWSDKLINSLGTIEGKFNLRLKESVTELREALMGVLGEKTLTDNKDRHFEFMPLQHGIKIIGHEDHYGDVYSVKYELSFAALAQAHRHRTINYQMLFNGDNAAEFGFYVPKIIREDAELKADWLKDMESVAEYYPQGTLVEVIEQGLAKNFALKCKERLCGRAQLEIMENTISTLEIMDNHYDELSSYNKQLIDNMTLDGLVPKCGFKGFTCKENCMWGIKGGLTREI